MQNTIKNALTGNHLNFHTLLSTPQQTVYKLGIQLENGRCDTIIDIRPEQDQVLIFTTCPTLIPSNHRARISEFITRANQGIIIGNFELNFNDGEVRYKATYIYDKTFPNSETIFLKNLYCSFNMMDRYLPGIMTVVYANILPSQAISQIENVTNPLMN